MSNIVKLVKKSKLNTILIFISLSSVLQLYWQWRSGVHEIQERLLYDKTRIQRRYTVSILWSRFWWLLKGLLEFVYGTVAGHVWLLLS